MTVIKNLMLYALILSSGILYGQQESIPVTNSIMHVTKAKTLKYHLKSYPSIGMNKKLNKYFQKKMKKAALAGIQVAYISKGKTKWVNNFGYRDYESKEKVNDSTLFMIASCAKPITALGALKLYEDGLLDLDKDINTYLPFTIENPNFPDVPITARMLMSHVSSIQDHVQLMNSLYTIEKGGDSSIELEEFVKDYFTVEGEYYSLEKNFLKSQPASKKSYSNAGYALLGYLVEIRSQMPFDEYTEKTIFKPLEMNSSYWFFNQIPHTNISKPHKLETQEKEQVGFSTMKHYGYPDYPDGQLRTTVSDYANFIMMVLTHGQFNGKQIFKKETIQDFLKVQFPEADPYQALAWNYNEFDNCIYYLSMPRFPSHTGVDPGVATVVSFDPETKSGAIIFSNTLTSNFKGHKILYQEMIKKLMKQANRKE